MSSRLLDLPPPAPFFPPPIYSHHPVRFTPNVTDVLIVKALLHVKLPLELIGDVIEYAEYWPCTRASTNYRSTIPNHYTPDSERVFILRTGPIGIPHRVQDPSDFNRPLRPRPAIEPFHVAAIRQRCRDAVSSAAPPTHPPGLPPPAVLATYVQMPEYPCRKIVFTIHSHDQGWADRTDDRGTYRDSWTWFEAGLERLDRTARPPRRMDIGVPSSESKCEFDFDYGPKASDIEDEADMEYLSQSSSSSPAPLPVLPPVELYTSLLRPIYPCILPRQTANTNADANPTTTTTHHNNNPSAPTPVYVYDTLISPNPHLTIQLNKKATRELQIHQVTWRASDDATGPVAADELAQCGRGRATGSGSFVREVRAGDCVTVWAHVRFPGWVNAVEMVEVEVYWAV